MLCPECGGDTNPTLKFCQLCNAPLDLDFDRIGAALSYESDDLVKERLERRITGYLYMSVFILVIVILFRIILDSPVNAELYPTFTVPAESVVQPENDSPTLPVEPARVELPK